VPAQIERAIDQADVAVSLREISQHLAGHQVELFGEQTHVIAAREQTLEQLSPIYVAALHPGGFMGKREPQAMTKKRATSNLPARGLPHRR
jgi:UDP-N-acetyl-D-mannosaminuronic acid transferase (WecB/TagA/CpsF family)